MIVWPSRGSRRIRLSYIGPWAPMLATVPDWWTSKWAGALWMPYRRVPPRLAVGIGLHGGVLPGGRARGRQPARQGRRGAGDGRLLQKDYYRSKVPSLIAPSWAPGRGFVTLISEPTGLPGGL